MSKTAKVVLGVVVSLAVVIGLVVGYFVSAKFTAETWDADTLARYEQMENVHGAMTNALKMQGFTVKNYGKTFIDTIDAGVKRYADKPQLMMQWVQEQKGVFPPDVHLKFMGSVERFYVKWEISQKNKISMVQEYRKFLNASVKGYIAKSFFDFPSKKMEGIMNQVISSAESKEAFKTGLMVAEDPFQ